MATRLPKAQQDIRYLKVLLEHHAGATQREIGERQDMSERNVRRIIKEFPLPLTMVQPLKQIETMVEAIKTAIEDLAVIGMSADDDRVRVLAIGKKLAAMNKLVEIHEQVGMMANLEPPKDDRALDFAASFIQFCRTAEFDGDRMSPAEVDVMKHIMNAFIDHLADSKKPGPSAGLS